MNSKSIRIKTINGTHDSQIEARVNKWLEENDVEVIDIKFQSTYSEFGRSIHQYAYIIYKI